MSCGCADVGFEPKDSVINVLSHASQTRLEDNVLASLSTVSRSSAAVGNVFKQKVLQGMDVDIFNATWWL